MRAEGYTGGVCRPIVGDVTPLFSNPALVEGRTTRQPYEVSRDGTGSCSLKESEVVPDKLGRFTLLRTGTKSSVTGTTTMACTPRLRQQQSETVAVR